MVSDGITYVVDVAPEIFVNDPGNPVAEELH